MTYDANAVSAAVARGLAAANDRPRPDDAHKSAANYAAMSADFRAGAWRHLRVDADLPQASNKAWGMVAETVKAICAEHGRVIHTHYSIWAVVRELASLADAAGDAETAAYIRNSFGRARSLHANFYENEESIEEVANGIALSEQLSGRLYELFRPEQMTH